MLSRFRQLFTLTTLLALSSLYADTNGYLGADVYVSRWQMGFASGKSMTYMNVPVKTNSPNPLIYMAGLSFSVVRNKLWALTYQGEVGTAKATIEMAGYDQNSQNQNLMNFNAATTILRTDHSLSVSRALGHTGLSIYAGGKLQMFGYNQPDSTLTMSGYGVAGTSNTTYSVVTSTYASKKNMLNYGPAVGLGYQFKIFAKSYMSIQAGFIYFIGEHTENLGVTMGTNTTKVSQLEKYNGIGFTALLSYIIPTSGNLFIQISARMQYYKTRTENATVSFTENGINRPTESVPGALDNAIDILTGLQVAAIYRVF